jgi:hypothetical protein
VYVFIELFGLDWKIKFEKGVEILPEDVKHASVSLHVVILFQERPASWLTKLAMFVSVIDLVEIIGCF